MSSIFDILPFTKPTVVPGGFPRAKFETPEGFEEMCKQQCAAAAELFRRKGQINVTAYLLCGRHPIDGTPGDCLLESHAHGDAFDNPLMRDAFVDIMRITATRGEAIACVVMYEAWMAPAPESLSKDATLEEVRATPMIEPRLHPQKRECLLVSIETRDTRRSFCGMIKRYGPRSASVQWEETPGLASRFDGIMRPVDLELLSQAAELTKKARGEGMP